MFVIAILVYLLTVVSFVSFPAMRFLFHEAITLAPEVAGAVCVVCFYPLVIFLVHLTRRMRGYEYGVYLTSQAKLAASLSVSLGLIGTFQGLTEMVSTISKSMQSGGDDLVERMNLMISSISSALSSMSYAFITSIFGVASSVIILLSLNYMITYYDKKASTENKTQDADDYNSERLEKISDELKGLNNINFSIMERLLACNQQNNLADDYLKNISELISQNNSITNNAAINISRTLDDLSSKVSHCNEKYRECYTGIIDGILHGNEINKDIISINTVFHENVLTLFDESVSISKNIDISLQKNSEKINEILTSLDEKENRRMDRIKKVAEVLSHE